MLIQAQRWFAALILTIAFSAGFFGFAPIAHGQMDMSAHGAGHGEDVMDCAQDACHVPEAQSCLEHCLEQFAEGRSQQVVPHQTVGVPVSRMQDRLRIGYPSIEILRPQHASWANAATRLLTVQKRE